MSTNLRQQVVPEKPKVLSEERIYVYAPIATNASKGIASFETRDFALASGRVKLRWPMEMMVEQLADPTARPSLTKVLSDEFEKTTTVVKLINPVTGVEYESATAEIKLNRKNRNALIRPELVMLGNDFEAESVSGPNGEAYNKYNIKRSNPMTTPTIMQIDVEDFILDNNIVKINWPQAADNVPGLVKIKVGGGLEFDVDDTLLLDLDVLKANTRIKPTYTVNDEDFIDLETGLAKRDDSGNTLINITKEAVGLGDVDNRAFSSWEYNEFGTNMKAYFQSIFDAKLNKSLWDGASGLFRDWDAPSEAKNTVQKWLELLDAGDISLTDAIASLNLFLGFYATSAELEAEHPASEALAGNYAYVTGGNYWAVRYNVDTWEWYDTGGALSFVDFIEANVANIKMNGVASVGSSGKLANSDHVHPSDTSKANADTVITLITQEPGEGDFILPLSGGNVNIPYVRTTQYLHNWKAGLPNFVQSADTNEGYWAGTAAEFDNVLFEELPNNTLIIVEDDEDYEAGEVVLTDLMDNIGVTVLSRSEFETAVEFEQFVVVDSSTAVFGVPVTVTVEPATESRGERRKIEPLLIEEMVTPANMAVIVDNGNGPTIAEMVLTRNRLIKTDSSGRVTVSTLNPSNIPYTSLGGTVVQLDMDRVLMADAANLIKVWNSGTVNNRPIGSNGANGLSVVMLSANKLVKTDANGGLDNVEWLEDNLIKSSTGEEVVALTEGAAVIAGPNNTVETWDSAGVENAILVRGATSGSIKLKTWSDVNKLLVTDADGTVRELPHGEIGQMLVSDAEDGPGWVDVPEAFEYLPQTVLTVNPTEEEALAFKGLVAVFAQVTPENMRPNCIYYY